MGGGVSFHMHGGGTSGSADTTTFHGTVVGGDNATGQVHVQLENGNVVSVPASKLEQPKAVIGLHPDAARRLITPEEIDKARNPYVLPPEPPPAPAPPEPPPIDWKAEAQRNEAERRAAMTPEERAAEDALREVRHEYLRGPTPPDHSALDAVYRAGNDINPEFGKMVRNGIDEIKAGADPAQVIAHMREQIPVMAFEWDHLRATQAIDRVEAATHTGGNNDTAAGRVDSGSGYTSLYGDILRTGVTPDVARVIDDTLRQLHDTYGHSPDYVGTISQARAIYGHQENWSSPTAVMVRDPQTGNAFLGLDADVINSFNQHYGDGAPDWTIVHDVKSLITHEYGHLLDFSHPPGAADDAVYQAIADQHFNGDITDLHRALKGISNYAGTHRNEAVAEAFALYKENRPDTPTWLKEWGAAMDDLWSRPRHPGDDHVHEPPPEDVGQSTTAPTRGTQNRPVVRADDKRKSGGQTRTNFVNESTGAPMGKTETGDTFERLFDNHGKQLLRDRYGDFQLVTGAGGGASRTTPLDLVTTTHGGELKTMSSNSKNLKTAIKAEEVQRKLKAVGDANLKPLLLVQVVNQDNHRVELYGMENFGSKAVSKMEHFGGYDYTPEDFAAAQAAAGHDDKAVARAFQSMTPEQKASHVAHVQNGVPPREAARLAYGHPPRLQVGNSTVGPEPQAEDTLSQPVAPDPSLITPSDRVWTNQELDAIPMNEPTLNRDQKEAISEYRLPDNAIAINEALRAGTPLTEITDEWSEPGETPYQDMHDQLLSVAQQSTLTAPVVSYRGMNVDTVPQAGETLSQKGWSSATVNQKFARGVADMGNAEGRQGGSHPVLLEINAAPGTHVINTHSPDTGELIFPPDTPFHVDSVTTDPNGLVHVKVSVPSTPTPAPPRRAPDSSKPIPDPTPAISTWWEKTAPTVFPAARGHIANAISRIKSVRAQFDSGELNAQQYQEEIASIISSLRGVVTRPPGSRYVDRLVKMLEGRGFTASAEFQNDPVVSPPGPDDLIETNESLQTPPPDHSDGVMIALKVPDPENYALPDGAHPDDLHLTLVNLGRANELSPDEKQGVLDAAQHAAARFGRPPLALFPYDYGTFDAEGQDGKPFVLHPYGQDLDELYAHVCNALKEHGLGDKISADHEFNPHVTLKYLQGDEQVPHPDYIPPDMSEVSFPQMRVSVGDDEHLVSLANHEERPIRPQQVMFSVEERIHDLVQSHNVTASRGTRASLPMLKAVYSREFQDTLPSPSQSLTAAALSRCERFLAELSRRNLRCPDADLFPPVGTPTPFSRTLTASAQLQSDRVKDLLMDSVIAEDPDLRSFNLSRALAAAAASFSPQVRLELVPAIRTLLADGNSSAARSLRAKMQLRDRHGRWIEEGKGVRFKVHLPGEPGNGTWYHGTVAGQDIPNGNVSVRLEDGRLVQVPAAKIDQPKAIIGQHGENLLPETSPSELDANAPVIAHLPEVSSPVRAQDPVSAGEIRHVLNQVSSRLQDDFRGNPDNQRRPVERLQTAVSNAVRDLANPDPKALDNAAAWIDHFLRDNPSLNRNSRDALLYAQNSYTDMAQVLRDYQHDAQAAQVQHHVQLPPEARRPFHVFRNDRAQDDPNHEARHRSVPLAGSNVDVNDLEIPQYRIPRQGGGNGRLATAGEIRNFLMQDFGVGVSFPPDAQGRPAADRLHLHGDRARVNAALQEVWGLTLDDSGRVVPRPDTQPPPTGDEGPLQAVNAAIDQLDNVGSIAASLVANNLRMEIANLGPNPTAEQWQNLSDGLDGGRQFMDLLIPGAENDEQRAQFEHARGLLNEAATNAWGQARPGEPRPPAAPAAPDPERVRGERLHDMRLSIAEAISELHGSDDTNDNMLGRQLSDAEEGARGPNPSADELRALDGVLEEIYGEIQHGTDAAREIDRARVAIFGLINDVPGPEAVPDVNAQLAAFADQLDHALDALGDMEDANFPGIDQQGIRDRINRVQDDAAMNVPAEQLQQALTNVMDQINTQLQDAGINAETDLNADQESAYNEFRRQMQTAHDLASGEIHVPGGPGQPNADDMADNPATHDQFGGAVPDGFNFDQEVINNGTRVQLYNHTTSDGREWQVGVRPNRLGGAPMYVIRSGSMHNGARHWSVLNNQPNWDSVGSYFNQVEQDAEQRGVAQANRERFVREQAQEVQRARADHERRVVENVDDGGQPLPPGWSRHQDEGQQTFYQDGNGNVIFQLQDGLAAFGQDPFAGGRERVGSYRDWTSALAGLDEYHRAKQVRARERVLRALDSNGINISNEERAQIQAAPDQAAVQQVLNNNADYQTVRAEAADAEGADILNPQQRARVNRRNEVNTVVRHVGPLAPDPNPSPEASLHQDEYGRDLPTGWTRATGEEHSGEPVYNGPNGATAYIDGHLTGHPIQLGYNDRNGHALMRSNLRDWGEVQQALEEALGNPRPGEDQIAAHEERAGRDEETGFRDSLYQNLIQIGVDEQVANQIMYISQASGVRDYVESLAEVRDLLAEVANERSTDVAPVDQRNARLITRGLDRVVDLPRNHGPAPDSGPIGSPGNPNDVRDSGAPPTGIPDNAPDHPDDRGVAIAPEDLPRVGAPPGFEARYHPDGVIQDRNGNEIRRGTMVRSRHNGANIIGRVVAVQQQPPYARIQWPDGRRQVRAGGRLAVVEPAQVPGFNAPAAPAPAAENPPPAPNVPVPQGNALQELQAIEDMHQAGAENGWPAISGITSARSDIQSAIEAAGNGDRALVTRLVNDAITNYERGTSRPEFAQAPADYKADVRTRYLNARQLRDSLANPAFPLTAPRPDDHVNALIAIYNQFPERAPRGRREGAQERAIRFGGLALRDAVPILQRGDVAAAEQMLNRAAFKFRQGGRQDLSDQVQQAAAGLRGGNAGAPAAAAPGDVPEPRDFIANRFEGDRAPRAMDPRTPGVVDPHDAPGNPPHPQAPNPAATQVTYQDWGVRANEIAQAARMRPSIDALIDARLDPVQLQELLNSAFGGLPGTTFGNKGYTVDVRSSGGRADYLSVSLVIRDANGGRVGSATRQFTKDADGRWKAYNAGMDIPDPNNQSSGFANALNRYFENFYIANNFKQVTVSASGAADNTGGFAWAMNGFGFKNPSNEIATILSKLRRGARDGSVEAQVVRQMEARAREGQRTGNDSLIPTPMELALVGWSPTATSWLGKRVMINHSWEGKKDLVPTNVNWQQRQNYEIAKLATARFENRENSFNVNRPFANSIADMSAPGLREAAITPAEADMVGKLMRSTNPSAAALPFTTKKKFMRWASDQARAGNWNSDIENVAQTLRQELLADYPQQTDLGVGTELQTVSLDSLMNNSVPGWDVHALGAEPGEAHGINPTFVAIHSASGQQFFVKQDDAFGRHRNEVTSTGAEAEADVNAFLRAVNWPGIEGADAHHESGGTPQDQPLNMVIMHRVGDNLDLIQRPNTAGAMGNARTNDAFRHLAQHDQLFRMIVMDGLLGNRDRHANNYMLGEGSDGRWWLFPIDHGHTRTPHDGAERLDPVELAGSIINNPYYSQKFAQALREYTQHITDENLDRLLRGILEEYRQGVSANPGIYRSQDFQRKMIENIQLMERRMAELVRLFKER